MSEKPLNLYLFDPTDLSFSLIWVVSTNCTVAVSELSEKIPHRHVVVIRFVLQKFQENVHADTLR